MKWEQFIEPTCAFCTVGSYAPLSVCLSVCMDLTKNTWPKIISQKVLQLGLWSFTVKLPLLPSSSLISKAMFVTSANHKVGSLPTSSCIFQHFPRGGPQNPPPPLEGEYPFQHPYLIRHVCLSNRQPPGARFCLPFHSCQKWWQKYWLWHWVHSGGYMDIF